MKVPVIINLLDVYEIKDADLILYALLKERKPEESISHKKMPAMIDHRRFIKLKPYKAWYLIQNGSGYAGAIYLTHRDEVGISIFERFRKQGYATQAIRELLNLHPGPKLANINPQNAKSIALFEQFNARLIQNTYAFNEEPTNGSQRPA